MRIQIKLSTLAIELLTLCIILIIKNVSAIEYNDMAIRVQVYHHEGSPLLETPLTSDTIIAGTPDTLVAKIFDRNNVWLSKYENPDSGRMYIRWKIEELYGYGNSEKDLLSDTAGHMVVVNSFHAYTTYRIIASFKNTRFDTVHLMVRPIPQPNIVSIQTEKNKRIYIDMKIDSLRLTGTVTPVYAIVLDQFGNFIRYATNTVWLSTDTSSLTVTPGDTSAGECILSANSAKFKSAKVIVRDIKEGLVDTLSVVNAIVSTTFDKDQNFTVLSNPVYYSERNKLKIKFPCVANHMIRVYTLSGNCVKSLKSNSQSCSIMLPPGMYAVTVSVAGVNSSSSIRLHAQR